ncbi:MAG: hypothetical protein D8M53_01620 [Armatimonadetes bacterium]|nr:hypothetical protein [Armatimonadota bacterium]
MEPYFTRASERRYAPSASPMIAAPPSVSTIQFVTTLSSDPPCDGSSFRARLMPVIPKPHRAIRTDPDSISRSIASRTLPFTP